MAAEYNALLGDQLKKQCDHYKRRRERQRAEAEEQKRKVNAALEIDLQQQQGSVIDQITLNEDVACC